ncbi:MAG: hypothetical protein J1E65_01095 [Lachnospiraceae bacterium]|nr:hypothetical protein [Lachnospiraceae bacterium]
MGMMIGSNPSTVRRIDLKAADGTVVGSISYSTASRKTTSQKKPKRLQYNFKEISSQILRAKTPGNARLAVAKARSKIALLQRQQRNGEYDEKEVAMAILHARSMERVARKRLKNLEMEETVKKGGKAYPNAPEEEYEEPTLEDMGKEDSFGLSREEIQKLTQELRQAMDKAMRDLEEEMAANELTEELTEVISGDMDSADLEQLKKKHRADELREIAEADMKYLRALFDKLAKDKQNISNGSFNNASDAVSLEISGVEMPVEVAEAPVTPEGANIDMAM